MSDAFRRQQLRAMTKVIKVLRVGIQGFSKGARIFSDPIVNTGLRWYRGSPFAFMLGVSSLWGYVPIWFYYKYKETILNSDRIAKEQERIRLSLQKGLDPFPDYQYKEIVFNYHTYDSTAEMRAEGTQYETQAIWRQREAKSNLLANSEDHAGSIHELVRLEEERLKANREARVRKASDGTAQMGESAPLRSQEEINAGKDAKPPMVLPWRQFKLKKE